MKTNKLFVVGCLTLLSSVSLAAWGNNQNRDYEPLDGYNSIPHYQGDRVTTEDDDERAMGPYYENNNQYNYNKNWKSSQGAQQNQGHISMSDDSSGTLGDRIRSAIQKETSLSSNARAVIITSDQNGKVTLSGSVASSAEKSKVESIVKGINGVKSVDNKITVQNHR